MHPKSPLWLEDVQIACRFIIEDTARMTLADYLSNRQVRQSTERNFEIIGEALRRIEHHDETTVRRLTDHRQIIGLRNRLAHGYDDTDDETVLRITSEFIPNLLGEVTALLAEFDAQDDGAIPAEADPTPAG